MRLSDATIAISGMGLMGGSLALALRGKCRTLVGIARRQEIADLALSKGIVDFAYTGLDAVLEADIVVLATPMRHLLASIPELGAAMRPGSLLLDLGSTKAQVIEVMNELPDSVLTVGGHPMCGKETSGIESADATIFQGATFVLTPTKRSTDEAMRLATVLVEATGAHPLVADAARHDQAVAMISHLPYILASSLVQAERETSKQDGLVDALATSGFRDTTRLAASSVDMMLDILLTNRCGVEAALDHFEAKLAEVRRLLSDPQGLRTWLEQAQSKRREMFT